ncbi:alkaline phosphatase family protein [Burkholderia sp. LMG 32019]|uniref:alkaline phosphatase family protein n=1 Tax=Burkholderia sp. LMG 32019 TaxID=3158173 RepID=UPI003C2EFA55
MKALIIIAEGMDPVVLEHQVQRGHLPWFAERLRASHYRRLDCGPVPYEPSNLATAFSGVNPGRHGCFSYWSTRGDGELPRVLETGDVKAARVWEWPELSDLRFSVVNVQLTHPPKPLNGRLVTYPMSYSLNASYPRSLLSDLHRRGIRYAHDVTLFYTGQPFDAFAQDAWRVASAQLDTAFELAADTDVMIVNLTLIDRVSHFLWYEMRQDNPAQRPVVLQAYDFVDAACRRLQSLEPDATLVFSEIGFGDLDGFHSIDAALQAGGLQVLAGDGQVDCARSLAMETVQGSHGIALRGDLLGGHGARDSEVDEVRAFLQALRFDDGTPVLASVHHRDELYVGDHRHLAPTLIVKPANPKRPPLGDPRWARHVRRTAQSGWHRDQGFVLVDSAHALADPGGDAQLQQIAPTIAHLLGRAPAPQCEMGTLLQ